MIIGTVIGTIAVVLITVLVGVLLDRKLGIIPRPAELKQADRKQLPAATHGAGEAPATALRVRASQLARLRTQRCTACRAAMTNEADDTVRYNERELLVLHFACPRCGAKRRLYVQRS